MAKKKNKDMWQSIGKIAQRVLTDLKGAAILVWDNGEAAAIRLKSLGINELRDVRRIAYELIILLTLLMVAGVGLGYIGYVTGQIWLMHIGRFVLAVDSVFFAAGLGYLFFRSTVVIEAIVLLCHALEKIPLPTSINWPGMQAWKQDGKTGYNVDGRYPLQINWSNIEIGVTQDQAKGLLKGAMSVMAWLTLVGIYATVFPVYANPVAFLLVLAITFFFAYAIVGWELKGKLPEKVALFFVCFVLLAATINFGQAMLRSKQWAHHVRQQRNFALDYEREAEAKEQLYSQWGVEIEGEPAYYDLDYEKVQARAHELRKEFGPEVKAKAVFSKRISLKNVCDKCIDEWGEVVCDCLKLADHDRVCSSEECQRAREAIRLNNARLDYSEAQAKLTKLEPAYLQRQEPHTLCDDCVSLTGEVVCDCTTIGQAMGASLACTTPQCIKVRHRLQLNQARGEYEQVAERIDALESKLRPETPGEFYRYGKSALVGGMDEAREIGEKLAIGSTSESLTAGAESRDPVKTLLGAVILLAVLIFLIAIIAAVAQIVRGREYANAAIVGTVCVVIAIAGLAIMTSLPSNRGPVDDPTATVVEEGESEPKGEMEEVDEAPVESLDSDLLDEPTATVALTATAKTATTASTTVAESSIKETETTTATVKPEEPAKAKKPAIPKAKLVALSAKLKSRRMALEQELD